MSLYWRITTVGIAAMAGVGVGSLRSRSLTRQLAAAERAAHTDPLTGVANRAGLRKEFSRLASRARPTELIGLALLDLDGFKQVNDRFGHGAGDRILEQVGRRLEQCRLRGDEALVARLGGDEFAVMFLTTENDLTQSAAAKLADDVVSAIACSVELGATRIEPRASVGIAWAPAGRATLPRLLAEADRAMYHAKSGSCDETLRPSGDPCLPPAPRRAFRSRDDLRRPRCVEA